MAFSNVLSLIALTTCALFISTSPVQVNALSVHPHGSHLAARSVAHGALAKRASSKRCKQRPTTTSSTQKPTSTTTSTSTPKSTPKPSSTSSNTGGNTGGSGNGGSSGGGGGGDDGGVARGLAWATDDRWVTTIAKGAVSWAYHWADGPISGLPSDVEYIPMYWGLSNKGAWEQRKAEFKTKWPKHILGFNEPDISSQSNMDPQTAANEWIAEIQPFGKQGVTLISPAVAFDLNWLGDFITAVQKQGGWVDSPAIHWYGDFRDIDQLKSYITDAFNRWGKKVWLTEVGITTKSGPNAGDVQNFLQDLLGFAESSGKVARIAWFGCFPSDQPIDGFASAQNAFFTGSGALNALGNIYIN
jgi:hypothetical protein